MGRPLPFESASKLAGLTRPVQPMILWEHTDNQAGAEFQLNPLVAGRLGRVPPPTMIGNLLEWRKYAPQLFWLNKHMMVQTSPLQADIHCSHILSIYHRCYLFTYSYNIWVLSCHKFLWLDDTLLSNILNIFHYFPQMISSEFWTLSFVVMSQAGGWSVCRHVEHR